MNWNCCPSGDSLATFLFWDNNCEVVAPSGAKEGSPWRKPWVSVEMKFQAPVGAAEKMAHTFNNLLIHIIFSTRGRADLTADEIRPDLHAYMGAIIRNLKGSALAIDGTRNHIHILALIPTDIAVADFVRDLKCNSSKWVREKWALHKGLAWQTGYAVFAVSESSKAAVARYIAHQEEHHRKVKFDEEFVAILRKHNIVFDPRFVLD